MIMLWMDYFPIIISFVGMNYLHTFFFTTCFYFFVFLNAINCHFKETLKKHFTMRHVQKFIRIIKDYNSIIISARKLKCDVKHLTLTPQSIAFSYHPQSFQTSFGDRRLHLYLSHNFWSRKKSGFSSYCCVCVSILMYYFDEKNVICGKIFFWKWNHIMEKDYTAIFPL